MPTVTVVGATGAVIPVSVDGGAAFSLAQAYAAALNGLAAGGSLAAYTLPSDGGAPSVPAGKVGEGVIASSGLYFVPSGYSYITDGAAGPVTIVGAGNISSVSVLAGTGGTTYLAGPAGGSFIASGNNLFEGSTGNYTIATGNGDDSIIAGSGNDMIYDGGGANIVALGSGADTLYSQGSDLIYGGGSDTIVATGSSNTIIGGNSDFILSTGSSTVFGGKSTSVFESGTGALTFVATVNGSATIGGASASVFGASGSNITLLDTSGVTYVMAGAGNETLEGAFTSGSLMLFGGSGTADLVGGAGADTLTAGSGNNILTGGAGANDFNFSNGFAGGNVTITDFGSSAGNLVQLFGYGANAVQTALASATGTNTGGSKITLSDNTTVTFSDLSVSALKAHSGQFLQNG